MLALLVSGGCSLRRVAVNSLAKALASAGDVYAADEDPELVRDALPFALKTIESLLAEQPEHRGLLLGACSGFTQYAYAFPETDAELVEASDYPRAQALRRRALALYLRARGYCLRGLEMDHPGIEGRLQRDPAGAVAGFRAAEVPLLYWTGAAWGAAIAAGKDRPALVADLPAVKALIERALALEEDFGGGALHAAMITLEGLPAAMGGSAERARRHFERAVELGRGRDAAPYVALAESVAVPAQDRDEFEGLLARALNVDPDAEPRLRLQNLVAQRRARALQGRVEELFLEPANPEDPSP